MKIAIMLVAFLITIVSCVEVPPTADDKKYEMSNTEVQEVYKLGQQSVFEMIDSVNMQTAQSLNTQYEVYPEVVSLMLDTSNSILHLQRLKEVENKIKNLYESKKKLAWGNEMDSTVRAMVKKYKYELVVVGKDK